MIGENAENVPGADEYLDHRLRGLKACVQVMQAKAAKIQEEIQGLESGIGKTMGSVGDLNVALPERPKLEGLDLKTKKEALETYQRELDKGIAKASKSKSARMLVLKKKTKEVTSVPREYHEEIEEAATDDQKYEELLERLDAEERRLKAETEIRNIRVPSRVTTARSSARYGGASRSRGGERT